MLKAHILAIISSFCFADNLGIRFFKIYLHGPSSIVCRTSIGKDLKK